MTILDQLADHARERVEYGKEKVAADEMRRRAFDLGREGRLGSFAFEKALKKPGISFICECKKASPSKGLIAPDFPYLKIAKEYEAAGADCISVLTEPKWFLGSDAYLREIAESVGIPCLRKDFTVDEYGEAVAAETFLYRVYLVAELLLDTAVALSCKYRILPLELTADNLPLLLLYVIALPVDCAWNW